MHAASDWWPITPCALIESSDTFAVDENTNYGGKVIIESMGDKRWPGWSKMEYIHRPVDGGRTLTVHYVGKWENGVLTAIDDFKFK